MPALKRRSNGAKSASIQPDGSQKRGKSSRHLQDARASTSRQTLDSAGNDKDEGEFDGDNFRSSSSFLDDDVDLLAASRSEAMTDRAAIGGEVEMFSDEDLEGGFEEVEQEEEREEGDDDDDDDDAPGSSDLGQQERARRKHKSLFAIPSRDEMNQLKNTSELYTSNIFKLKLEEMLSEVQPKYDQSAALDYVLRKIKSVVEGMETMQPQVLPVALKKLSQMSRGRVIKVPFPDPQPDENAQIKYGLERPARIQVAGSWILKAAAQRPGGLDVDIVLMMPSSLFQEKDTLNMRYFHKRAFYLAAIAASVGNDASLSLDISYTLLNEDTWRPILLLKPKQDKSLSDFSKLKGCIRIHLAHEEGFFPVARLAPDRNNVRTAESEQTQSTPLYNASIIKDSLYTPHLVYLNSVKSRCPAFCEASVLLKTWTSQRCFGSGPNKLGAKGKGTTWNARRIASGTSGIRFVLMMILAHLVNGPDKELEAQFKDNVARGSSKLSPGSSSFQLFRGVLDYISLHDFERQPVFMKATDGIVCHRDKIRPQTFVDEFGHCLVDPTGSVNLFDRVPAGSLQFLRQEARATIALLSAGDQDNFDAVFMNDSSRPVSRFDEIIKLKVRGSGATVADVCKYGSPCETTIGKISNTLKLGLSDRQSFLTAFSPQSATWATSESFSGSNLSSLTIEVGVRLDPVQAFRLVDHGPRPEDVHAAEDFKALWGDLSELRRFRDGRVVESVVWNVKGPFERQTIPRRIIQYLLARHCRIELPDKAFMSNSFRNLLRSDPDLCKQAHLTDAQELGHQGVNNSFDALAKTLRGIEGLPLSLISVVASDAGLRQAGAMISAPFNLSGAMPLSASFLPMHEFVLTFESSGQWPDDIEAIHAMKMAFFKTIAEKVVVAMPGTKAAIVFDIENDDNVFSDSAAIEIIVPAGFAFRGRIHHERERVLLQRIVADKEEESSNRAQAKAALDLFEKRFVHSVRHYDHLGALMSQFPSLSEAVRLFKRWISSQLLSNHVSDILLDLLAAEAYISANGPGIVPATGHAGFVRIVQRLAAWDWREHALSVPLVDSTSANASSQMPTATTHQIETSFSRQRRLDPSMNHFAWFVATENEPRGCCWARDAPSVATADAITRLARGAVQILEGGALLNPVQIKSLFIPSLEHFDFLVHLEPAAINRYSDAVAFSKEVMQDSQKRLEKQSGTGSRLSKYRNLSERHEVRAGLNTGQALVQLLESLYADTFRLYYDALGGLVIGGLFNPALANKPRPFRVGLGFNARPANDGNPAGRDVVLSQAAVLDEVRRVGEGLVREVIVQK